MSNGIAHHLCGGTGQFQLSASREILLPRNCLGGDFKGLHFVVMSVRVLAKHYAWSAGRITNVTTARVIKTNPTTPAVALMVEKVPFSAPFAADVTQRRIRAL